MGRYLTTPEFKDWARDKLPTANDALIDDSMAAAEQALDNALHRRVAVAGDAATARVFAPSSSCLLLIDDATEVTAITVDGTTISLSDCQLEPLNGLSLAGESVPYTSIRHVSQAWTTSNGFATISVTAKWGWPAIPSQVKDACKYLTKASLEGRDISAGLAAITAEGFGISEREAMAVRKVIRDYQRYDRAGIA